MSPYRLFSPVALPAAPPHVPLTAFLAPLLFLTRVRSPFFRIRCSFPSPSSPSTSSPSSFSTSATNPFLSPLHVAFLSPPPPLISPPPAGHLLPRLLPPSLLFPRRHHRRHLPRWWRRLLSEPNQSPGIHATPFSLLCSSISLPSLTLIHFLGFFPPLLIKNSDLGAQHRSILDEMDLFHRARLVQLRSHLDKYLMAEDDQEHVCQDRQGASYNARWAVELVEGPYPLVRLKSRHDLYLTASNEPFRLGFAGRKVIQTAPASLNSSVEWEPIRDGFQVMLKTRDGRFLRSNGGLPPWRNSVTHCTRHCSIAPTWILWDVHILDITPPSPSTHPSVALDPPPEPDRGYLSSLVFDVSLRLSKIEVL